MQEEELIIRKEAKEFFEHSIEGSEKFNAIDDFHEIKSRLYDFYSPEAKSIFVDEIEKQITTLLQKHRDMACVTCNQHGLSIFNPKQKLGQCLFCIAVALIGTVLGWSFTVYFWLFNSPHNIILIVFSVAVFFTLLLSAHATAYYIKKNKRKVA